MGGAEISQLVEGAQRRFTRGDIDGAIVECKRIIVKDPGNYEAHQQLANCYEAKGTREKINAFYNLAIREVNFLLEQHPNDPELHDWLVRLYQKRGKLTELSLIYRKKLESDPYNEIISGVLRKISTISLLDIPSGKGPAEKKGLKRFSWLMDFLLLPFTIITLLLAIMIPYFRPSLSLGIILIVLYVGYKICCLPPRRKEKGQW